MKRKDVTREALHRAALRSTRASAALENRSVPVGVTRSERVERFLAARLTGIEPGYGKTPVDPEEADALTPQAREIFGDAPKKIDLYEAEQAVNDEVSIAFLDDIADGRLVLADILTDAFLRGLHQKLYGDLWTWAGRYRTRDLNIGVEPQRIAVELRGSLDNRRYRWEHTDDWTARELGIAVHAETVRIRGLVDGNGRTTRLLADLVFLAAQDAEAIAETYDWDIDKRRYIALLRQYDVTRDPKPLAAFVPVRRLDDVEHW